MNTYKDFWENYYKNHKDPGEESPFARFVIPFIKEDAKLFELGCGNGRDSVFFNEMGVKIVAFDQCDNEIDYLNGKYGSSSLKFEQADFTSLGDKGGVDYIYSRFTLHSVSKDQEVRTIKWAYETLEKNGLFFIEIRSVNDELYGQGDAEEDNAFITDHYRRFVQLDSFVKRLENAGFIMLYKVQSKGLAPYKDEDPVVIRVIAQKVV